MVKLKDIWNWVMPPDRQPDNGGSDGGDGTLIDDGFPDMLTRQNLLDGIVKHFKDKMALTTTKQGLLFNTSFSIYMNEDDYRDQEPSFGFTVKELVNVFHRIIVEKRKDYPNYHPHANYWEFHFIPFSQESIIEGLRQEVLKIDRKKILVISFLYPTKGEGATAAAENQRATVTVHGKDSYKMSNMAFNAEALRGITIQSRDRFQVDFNNFSQMERDALSDEQRDKTGQNARATIKVSGARFLLPAGPAEAIYMNSDNLRISGRGGTADTAGGITVVRIDSDKVMDNQLRLRYNPGTHELFMTSQGEVKLNEVDVTPNEEKVVYENSRILINGDIQLEIKNIKRS